MIIWNRWLPGIIKNREVGCGYIELFTNRLKLPNYNVAFIFTLCSFFSSSSFERLLMWLGHWWTDMNVCYDKKFAVVYFWISDGPLGETSGEWIVPQTRPPTQPFSLKTSHCHFVNTERGALFGCPFGLSSLLPDHCENSKECWTNWS